MAERSQENRDTWNKVSEFFRDASYLPSWGPFSVGSNLDLLGKIEGRTFLEVACGSGRSIRYLLDRGAKKVYGIDFSEKQIAEASRFNCEAVDSGRVKLINEPMEVKVAMEPVDVVFSVYGIGWTQEPENTFANIYSYLEPGGLFVWSWDHTFFTDVAYKSGKFSVVHSYHNEEPVTKKDWWKNGCNAYITYRKISTWFKLLKDAGFEIEGYYEPEPINLERASGDPKQYYSIQKARLIPSTFIFACRKR